MMTGHSPRLACSGSQRVRDGGGGRGVSHWSLASEDACGRQAHTIGKRLCGIRLSAGMGFAAYVCIK